MTNPSDLYEQDYGAWAQRQAALLRAGDFAALDLDHLLEELADMGRSERRELNNRLTVLLAHLLKWQYQLPQLAERWREFDGRSWRATLIEQRDRLAKRLRESPGLRSQWHPALAEAWADARLLAAKETGLPPATFPTACPYSDEQIMDDGFYPEPCRPADGGANGS